MNVDSYLSVVHVTMISIGFYIVFAYNNIIDSIFYALGRTDLMLYQSLIVNTVFYGGMYLAYKTGSFVPTLERIAIMFGVGMAIDSGITFILYGVMNKKNQHTELRSVRGKKPNVPVRRWRSSGADRPRGSRLRGPEGRRAKRTGGCRKQAYAAATLLRNVFRKTSRTIGPIRKIRVKNANGKLW